MSLSAESAERGVCALSLALFLTHLLNPPRFSICFSSPSPSHLPPPRSSSSFSLSFHLLWINSICQHAARVFAPKL
ncbi:hypothetical protein QQF64_002295 [Cirrhinus molitorella]|uniref:Secreted protein n=1 Tax=Cirrhinus molitorella TaxID=172907 RepID=A0ABR3MPX4_9TELE